jgi:hypothetical protein
VPNFNWQQDPLWDNIVAALTDEIDSRIFSTGFSYRERLMMEIKYAFMKRYSDTIPVGLRFVEGGMAMIPFMVEVSVAGQKRLVGVTRKQEETLPHSSQEIIDEVLFAAFLLLDEDEDWED